ncbi:MAG TPA: sugar phosphate nucleotidyltransferase [Candidatus Saccharimonadales bacterium]|nr:sugar phosphate nucleotidyltransferase [Candidatus Saccharimonadales bacterium]
MIVVIIAGGSGTRLWPLSTSDYPKHLLRVNGDSNSLLQNTYERAKQVAESKDSVYVVSEAGHIKFVREQLPELTDDHFIVEPARRGTASCLAAALVRLNKAHKGDETVTFVAADHHVRDHTGFVQSFRMAERTSVQTGRIVMVGVEPDYPSTGLGYIQKGDLLSDDALIYSVHSFKEKPDYKTAQEYLKSGNYLWNCSYHVGSIDMFVNAMQAHAPELFDNFQKLSAAKDDDYEKTYLQFENISIEYALIEKADGLMVVPASFDWMDLGSFADLSKAVDHDEAGNHMHGWVESAEVENSFIQNHEEKPVAVIGLDNIVVINTPNGILVARKDLSQKVGDISKRFQK